MTCPSDKPQIAPSSSRWLAEHIAPIRAAPAHTIPRFAATPPVLPGVDLWDLWPLQLADGSNARFGDWTVWFVLSAPALPDPNDRHDVARIRLMSQRITRDGRVEWADNGNALPDGLCPGSREWAGSALYDLASREVTLFLTAAGHAGEARPSFAQRLFHTSGTLAPPDRDGAARITGWTTPCETFAADETHYMPATQATGVPGFIKGFRDPAHFRDPVDGARYLLFTGSLMHATSDWNGCIGIARATGDSLDQWQQLPPLVTADGLNNEQERPHILHHGGHYYLFWSTQSRVFAPNGPKGPNGLYAMVAPGIAGPWQPVNGTGLVAANPEAAPYQAYSWWVSSDLSVAGFSDFPDVPVDEVLDDPAWRRRHFGGTPAPIFAIALDGARAWVRDSVG